MGIKASWTSTGTSIFCTSAYGGKCGWEVVLVPGHVFSGTTTDHKAAREDNHVSDIDIISCFATI